ncbi:MAG: argininosuccinate lyase [Spirochaetaceae bacterium]|nr:MAG: argininosuccinate lyase [Spirochaetaceae bacterium]
MAKHETISPRVQVGFDPLWVETHYGPQFEEHLTFFFHPLLKTHLAWITMLAEQKIVPRDSAAAVCGAIRELQGKNPEILRPFVPEYGDVYVHVEKHLEERIGKEHVGHLALARTRPEPVARMALRDKLLNLLDAVLGMREKLLDTAEEHAETVMTGYTHAQPAQATTYGHYLLGAYDPIEEDCRFFKDAYANVNRCTLGCGALAGTGFPVDRYRVAELLGFDGIVENTYACVSSNDFMLVSANAVIDMAVTLSRVMADFVEWASFDVGMMLTAPQFSSYSSLMPQKLNTTVLEGGRLKCSYCLALAQNVANLIVKGHYGDVKEIDMVWMPTFKSLDYTTDTIRLLGEVIRTMQINRERMLELARSNFCTVSELSDEIYRQRGLSYRTAHAIAAHVVNQVVKEGLLATDITTRMVDEAAVKVTGKPLNIPEQAVKESLDPVTFVERRNLVGGPAPKEVRRMIKVRRERLKQDRAGQSERKQNLEKADLLLRQSVAAIMK